MHQYIELFNGVKIPLYNLMIGIGAIFGFLTFDSEIKKQKIPYSLEYKFYILTILSVFIGFTGARLFELINHAEAFNIANIQKGGLTFLGGFSVAFVFLIVICPLFKLPTFNLLNILTPCIAIVHAFGRIGCFLAGCCYGCPTKSIIGVCYPQNSIPVLAMSKIVPLHPTQLYESFFCLIIYFSTLKLISFNFRFIYYLISYGIFRFLIEYLRADDRGTIITKTFSPSQIISILLIVIGIALFFKLENEKK